MADVWTVQARQGAAGEYLSSHPRLFVVLEESQPRSLSIGEKPMTFQEAGRLSYIPAGHRIWSHVSHQTGLMHLDLHFDLSTLVARLPGNLDVQRLSTPRLMFENNRVLMLARMLAAECIKPSLHDLYGEGLMSALLAELFQIKAESSRGNGALNAHRLRHVTEFIEANCLRSIKLQELADLVGLSQSYFSSAFKASTGMAPHQWQMKARIEQVKHHLLLPGANLAHIAGATGFADQAHMTRVFKHVVGVTPAAWLRAQPIRQ
ncbi:helix-turn-helix domain-containing protein [Devosia aurantiaca]|uniref:helix-turn-helix domain-containing protein n=1 Tax=Devosia aurantiaca TaxID=2714858 RepID=UPI001F2B8BAB|nr:AraC family transcriptional regulator [Devosia aurantiaca]